MEIIFGWKMRLKIENYFPRAENENYIPMVENYFPRVEKVEG